MGENIRSEDKDDSKNEWDDLAETWDEEAVDYSIWLFSVLWDFIGIECEKLAFILDFGCGSGILIEKLQNCCRQVVGVDSSLKMIEKVKQKIDSRKWRNVEAFYLSLAGNSGPPTNDWIKSHEKKFDLIIASSVLSFIPEAEIKPTMSALGRLLKPGGLLVHSDWPISDDNADGFNESKAKKFFDLAGLELKMTEIKRAEIFGVRCEIFLGLAMKPLLV